MGIQIEYELVRASHFTDSLIENLHEIHGRSAKSFTKYYKIKTREYEKLEKDLAVDPKRKHKRKIQRAGANIVKSNRFRTEKKRNKEELMYLRVAGKLQILGKTEIRGGGRDDCFNLLYVCDGGDKSRKNRRDNEAIFLS